MIAIVHSIYSQSVHAPARNAGLMDNDAERYCMLLWNTVMCTLNQVNIQANFGINRLIRYQVTTKKQLHRRTDGRTDGRTDTDNR